MDAPTSFPSSYPSHLLFSFLTAPVPALSLALTSSPLLLSIRGLSISPSNVFIVAVFLGHVVAVVLVSHPLFSGVPHEAPSPLLENEY